MCPDKKRPAGNTCRIAKGLDAVWAHFCPSKPCLPLSTDGTSGEALLREAFAHSAEFALENLSEKLKSRPILCIDGTKDTIRPMPGNRGNALSGVPCRHKQNHLPGRWFCLCCFPARGQMRSVLRAVPAVSRTAPVERPAPCGPQRRGGCCKGFCRGSGAENRLPPA